MSTHADPDWHLIQAIAQGDHDAVTVVYGRHGSALLKFLFGLLGDRHRAEEVLQEVVVAIWQGAATFRGECKVRTWLFQIARNQAYKVLRDSGIEHVPLDEEFVGDIPDWQHEFDVVDALRRAFDKISPPHREVLVLKFAKEFTMVEIAEILDVPLGTVQSRLYRAQRLLSRQLQIEGIDHA